MNDTSSTSDGAKRLGQLVSGRYRIEQLLGEGGMGAVYLAEHTLMRKRVALKLLHPDMSNNEEVLARFQREAQAAAHIEHPNIVAATDFGKTEDGGFFLVLEYVEGTSLRHVVGQGPVPVARALHVVRQIALALERAHGAGIVHRDLKPENVMLVKKGDDPDFVKVLDFGIAKVEPSAQREPSNQPLTRMGTILGTPEYMAPEQALGEAVGPAADLYAVGVMLYEMLTGKHPFDAADSMAVLSMHMIAPIPPIAEHAPGVEVPAEVEAVARKLLEKEAKNRPAGARALVELVDAAAAASGIELVGSSPSFSRDSLVRASPSEPRVSAAAPSTRDVGWNASDAFAKTSVGTPAAPLPPVRATTGIAPSPLDAMRDRAREVVGKLPRNVVIGAAVGAPVVLIALVVVLVLVLRSPTTDASTGADGGETESTESAEPAKPQPKTAPEAKIKAATAQGPDALEALAKEYPDDPRVLRALVLEDDQRGRTADALHAIKRLVALGPAGVQAADPEVVGIVVGATGVAETSDQAFALLEGPLGERGVDALIELSHVKSSRQVALRATRALARPDVRAHASPAAGAFLDMKSARTCQGKYDVLERAKSEGDARLLPVLKSLKEPRGCGFMGMRDCYPCLRKDSALDDAIDGIEARSK